MYNDESTNCGETISNQSRTVGMCRDAKKDHLYPLKGLFKFLRNTIFKT